MCLWLGWEARMDSHGRVFYIDHNTRSTTWQRPTSTVTDDTVDEHRRQLDRRSHFHFDRTLSPPSKPREWQRLCVRSMCVCVCVCVCVSVCVRSSRPVSQTNLKRLKWKISNLTCMFPGSVPLKIFRFSKRGTGQSHMAPKLLVFKC